MSMSIDVPLEEFLEQSGHPTPQPCFSPALIDTGASHSTVNPRVTEQLKSPPSSFTDVLVPGASGGDAFQVPVHDLRVWLEPGSIPFEVLAVGASSATEGILFIIGRDILDQCTFVYNGPKRAFSLEF